MLWSIIILLLCIILGMPIYVGILLASTILICVILGLPETMIVTAIFDGIGKFTLTAVPFFILAGSFIAKSKMAERMVGSITPWLVKVKGGVAIASVVANEIFGAVSGASAAATGTIGRTMYPAVSKAYGDKFSLGLFASCGGLAIIMPPSITLILYGVCTNTSIGDLFLAGIVPAIIIGLLISAYIIAVSKPIEKAIKFNLKEALKKTLHGVPILLLPVFVLGGIYRGIFTPTEAGAFAAVYSLLLPLIVYREINLSQVLECLKETAKICGQIFILIGASVVFSQALALAQVPALLQKTLGGLSPYVFLIVFNIVMLLVGCIFDPTSAVLVFSPIVYPIAEMIGIDLIHLGIIFAVNLAIGMFTPPFGINLFVMQSIFKKPLDQIAISAIPYFIVFIVALIIITYIPQLYMWVPHLGMQ